jgi:hypothetical protein
MLEPFIVLKIRYNGVEMATISVAAPCLTGQDIVISFQQGMFIVCVLAVVTTRTLVYVRELQRWCCSEMGMRQCVERLGRADHFIVDGHRRLNILACRNDRMFPRTHRAGGYTEASELL